jgi:hypothetical protein
MIEDLIKRAFGHRKHPGTVLRPDHALSASHEEAAIQQDFGVLQRERLDEENAGMMLNDSFLMSDEAFLYFLPSLASIVIRGRSNLLMLRARVEKVDRKGTSEAESDALSQLAQRLTELENDLDSKDP